MPYNYIIDPSIRQRLNIEFANSVIIFDEAHNVAPVAESVSSFQIKAKSLDDCLKELHGLREEFDMNEQKVRNSTKKDIKAIEEHISIVLKRLK